MGSFYSHPAESSDDKKENLPGPMASSPYPGSTSSDVNLETDKTPLQTGGGLICDPRSPNPEISRTPISVVSSYLQGRRAHLL